MRKISISQDFIMEERYKYFIFEYATELHVPSMPKGFTFSPLENVKKITIDFGDYVTNFKYYASIFPKAQIYIEKCWTKGSYTPTDVVYKIENLDRFHVSKVSDLSSGNFRNAVAFAEVYTKQSGRKTSLYINIIWDDPFVGNPPYMKEIVLNSVKFDKIIIDARICTSEYCLELAEKLKEITNVEFIK